jgi:hypothetical protein
MGTNYYVDVNSCDHCGRSDTIHFGKSSAGWRFSLHVTPELPDLKAWERLLWTQKIRDEYGRKVEARELLDLIRSKANERRHPNDKHFDTYDAVEGDFS